MVFLSLKTIMGGVALAMPSIKPLRLWSFDNDVVLRLIQCRSVDSPSTVDARHYWQIPADISLSFSNLIETSLHNPLCSSALAANSSSFLTEATKSTAFYGTDLFDDVRLDIGSVFIIIRRKIRVLSYLEFS